MRRLGALLAIAMLVSPLGGPLDAAAWSTGGRSRTISASDGDRVRGRVAEPQLGFPIPLKCTFLKRKAAGKALLGTLKCHAKAMVPGMPASSSCLQGVERKLAVAFHKYPGACPGEPDVLNALVEACADMLLANDPGADACAVKSAIGLGKGGNDRLVCAAKDMPKPGTEAACNTKADEKVVKALSKSGTCVGPSTMDDLHACTASIVDALPDTTAP